MMAIALVRSVPLNNGKIPNLASENRWVMRAADAIEGYDNLLTNVLQANLAQVTVEQSRVSVQQNQDMRKISAWAAIALVPTAIAGIYGMNFDNMPELHWFWGYPFALFLMSCVAGGIFLWFRHRGWIGETGNSARAKARRKKRAESES